MEIKTFGDKKITIRKAIKSDLKNAKKFQVFINSLVEEGSKLSLNKKLTVKEEKEFIERMLRGMQNKTTVYLVAECDNKIVGSTDVELERWGRNHIGKFGITIRDGFRGMGLGKHMMAEVIKLAKRELKPKPKIIQLTVYANNNPAINLYKKIRFKIVAKLPKQIQHKGRLIDELVMTKFL